MFLLLERVFRLKMRSSSQNWKRPRLDAKGSVFDETCAVIFVFDPRPCPQTRFETPNRTFPKIDLLAGLRWGGGGMRGGMQGEGGGHATATNQNQGGHATATNQNQCKHLQHKPVNKHHLATTKIVKAKRRAVRNPPILFQ